MILVNSVALLSSEAGLNYDMYYWFSIKWFGFYLNIISG